ncbi:MAG: hypothetical protein J0H29_05350 [Sphingobacteriales bacterium]|nr:hypothetical protein [Sphingobacteriales bacterium]
MSTPLSYQGTHHLQSRAVNSPDAMPLLIESVYNTDNPDKITQNKKRE